MPDNPFQSPTVPSNATTKLKREGRPKRSVGLTIWSSLLILNTVRHCLVLWFYDGFPEIPIDALVLSYMIDACYLVSACGLLAMKKWAVPLYFGVHSLTILRLLLASGDMETLLHHLASVKLLWYAIIPLGIFASVLFCYRRMTWK